MTAESRLPPRLVAALYFLGGGAAMVVMAYFGFMERGRGVLLTSLAGIAAGVGLTQLIWPPRPHSGEGPDLGDWARAPWPQRALWILGGALGVVATAVVTTVLDGRY